MPKFKAGDVLIDTLNPDRDGLTILKVINNNSLYDSYVTESDIISTTKCEWIELVYDLDVSKTLDKQYKLQLAQLLK